jgi:hypothetical protein
MYALSTSLLLVLLLVGCEGTQPVARVGVYHRVDDYGWNQTHSDTIFKSELGLRRGGTECVWSHISELDRGNPFNNKHDRLATELVGCSYDFGR